jgi:hypothetical protein
LEESCGGGSDGGGGGGGSDDGGLMRPMVRLEIGVTRMQVRVTRLQLGNNLVQSRAMRLANVQTFGPQCLASKRPKTEFYLRDLSVCADRKTVNLYVYLRNITNKSQF